MFAPSVASYTYLESPSVHCILQMLVASDSASKYFQIRLRLLIRTDRTNHNQEDVHQSRQISLVLSSKDSMARCSMLLLLLIHKRSPMQDALPFPVRPATMVLGLASATQTSSAWAAFQQIQIYILALSSYFPTHTFPRFELKLPY
jgi:hypothetical protein